MLKGIAALLIAFILGPMAEVYLRQALKISGGDPMIFVTKPFALVFLIGTVAMIVWTTWRHKGDRKIENKAQLKETEEAVSQEKSENA